MAQAARPVALFRFMMSVDRRYLYLREECCLLGQEDVEMAE
jgi:hypothetical protein